MKELTIELNEEQINTLREEFRTIRNAWLHHKDLYENSPTDSPLFNYHKDNYHRAFGWLQEFEDVMNILDVDTSELFGDIR